MFQEVGKSGIGDFHKVSCRLMEVVGVLFPRWRLTSF